jgi:hypothetical protein
MEEARKPPVIWSTTLINLTSLLIRMRGRGLGTLMKWHSFSSSFQNKCLSLLPWFSLFSASLHFFSCLSSSSREAVQSWVGIICHIRVLRHTLCKWSSCRLQTGEGVTFHLSVAKLRFILNYRPIIGHDPGQISFSSLLIYLRLISMLWIRVAQ